MSLYEVYALYARIVLKYLSILKNDSVFDLSGKLATLCGQRAKEILVVTDLKNIFFEEDLLIIRIGDVLKTTSRKCHSKELSNFQLIMKNTYAL